MGARSSAYILFLFIFFHRDRNHQNDHQPQHYENDPKRTPTIRSRSPYPTSRVTEVTRNSEEHFKASHKNGQHPCLSSEETTDTNSKLEGGPRSLYRRRPHAISEEDQNHRKGEWLEKTITPSRSEKYMDDAECHLLLEVEPRLPIWLTSDKTSCSSQRRRKVSVYNAELPRKASSTSHRNSMQLLVAEEVCIDSSSRPEQHALKKHTSTNEDSWVRNGRHCNRAKTNHSIPRMPQVDGMEEAGMGDDTKKKVGQGGLQKLTLCPKATSRSQGQQYNLNFIPYACECLGQDLERHPQQSCSDTKSPWCTEDTCIRDHRTKQLRDCNAMISSSGKPDYPMYSNKCEIFQHQPEEQLRYEDALMCTGGKKKSRTIPNDSLDDILAVDRFEEEWNMTLADEVQRSSLLKIAGKKIRRHVPHCKSCNCTFCENQEKENCRGILCGKSFVDSQHHPVKQRCSLVECCGSRSSQVSDANSRKSEQRRETSENKHVTPRKEESRHGQQRKSQERNSLICVGLENTNVRTGEAGYGESQSHEYRKKGNGYATQPFYSAIPPDIVPKEQSIVKYDEIDTDKGEQDVLEIGQDRKPRKSCENPKKTMLWSDSSQSKFEVPAEEEPRVTECNTDKNDLELKGFLHGAKVSKRRQSVCTEIEKSLNLVKLNGSKMSLHDLRKDMCTLVDNRVFESIHEDISLRESGTDNGVQDSLRTGKERKLTRSGENPKKTMLWRNSSQGKSEVPPEGEPHVGECAAIKNDLELQGFLQGTKVSNRRQSVCTEIEKTLNHVKLNGSRMSLYDLRKDLCTLVDNRVIESIQEDK